MKQHTDPKNGPKNKRTDTQNEADEQQLKTGARKENAKEERDTVPVDKDAQKYFDAQDEDQELRGDSGRDIPLY